MKLSVIICTHNPRAGYLQRVLDGLRKQTLPHHSWELLLVDNASEKPLADRFDLTWHPHSRHIREEQLGLTEARLRGIAEAAGAILVFVDDDNLLESDYLAESVAVGEAHPNLGVWGAGVISPEFEIQPEPELAPFVPMLALRTETRPLWSNELKFNSSIPYGAGMSVRLSVARRYAELVRSSPLRKSLDRKGQSLSSAGDLDLALIACEMGSGAGVFPSLRMTHLIPSRRVQEDYLLSLAEARIYSGHVLHSLYGIPPSNGRRSLGERLRHFFYFVRLSPLRRRFYLAEIRGEKRARADLSPGRN